MRIINLKKPEKPFTIRTTQRGDDELEYESPLAVFSPDGRWLATRSSSSRDPVNLYRLDAQGHPTSKTDLGRVGNIIISANSHWLAARAGDRIIRVWNLQNELSASVDLRGHSTTIAQVAFLKGSHRILSRDIRGNAFLWELSSAGPPLRKKQFTDAFHIAIRDNKFALSGRSKHRIWELTSDGEIKGPQELPLGKIEAAHRTGSLLDLDVMQNRVLIRLYDRRASISKPLYAVTSISRTNNSPTILRSISSPHFTPDGKWIIGRSPRGIHAWYVGIESNVDSMPTIECLSDEPSRIAVSHKRNLVAIALANGAISLVRLKPPFSNPSHQQLAAPSEPVRAIQFSGDGEHLFALRANGIMHHWKSAPGEKYSTVSVDTATPDSEVDELIVSPSGRIVLGVPSDNGRNYASTLRTRYVVWKFEKGMGRAIALPTSILAAELSPDGRLLLARSHTGVSLWDLRRKSNRLRTVYEHSKIRPLVATVTSNYICVVTTDARLQCWRIADGKANSTPSTLARLKPRQTYQLAIDSAGRWLAVSSKRQPLVSLFDLSKPRPVKLDLRGHGTGVVEIAFSPAGDLLASVGADRSVRLWSLTAGAANHGLVVHRDALITERRGGRVNPARLQFSSDGRFLFSYRQDRYRSFLGVNRTDMLRADDGRLEVEARRLAKRGLTKQEREKYLIERGAGE